MWILNCQSMSALSCFILVLCLYWFQHLHKIWQVINSLSVWVLLHSWQWSSAIRDKKELWCTWKHPAWCRSSPWHPACGHELPWLLFLLCSPDKKPSEIISWFRLAQHEICLLFLQKQNNKCCCIFFLFCSILRKEANQQKGNSKLKNHQKIPTTKPLQLSHAYFLLFHLLINCWL